MVNMDIPKSAKYKFALTGTNCSGKTTLALDITARLKKNAILAEIVSSQDRKITWKDAHFPVNPRAHWGMMTNLIHAEIQADLKGDADVIMTDRSVLDLYAIATYDHPEAELIAKFETAVLAWASTYTKIYYLEPLPYQEDNKRPNDSFRMATHGQLLKLFDLYQLDNVVKIPRDQVFKDIKGIIGLESNAPFAATSKWQAISEALNLTLLVKEPASEVSSDYDVWILSEPRDYSEDAAKVKLAFEAYWGSTNVDVMLAPLGAAENIPFSHALYEPK